MLKTERLTVSSNRKLIKNVNCTFRCGNIYLILGINGSGKTTLFRTLTNLVKKNRGIISFDNKPFKSIKKEVFYYESANWLDKDLSGLDYLKFVKNQWKSVQNVESVIHYMGMTDYVNDAIKKYSLGMRQRTVIAMYLISNARYLIMDEISNGLDEESRDKLYVKLQELAVNYDKCIIISSHYQSDIIPFADHVFKIKKFELVEVK